MPYMLKITGSIWGRNTKSLRGSKPRVNGRVAPGRACGIKSEPNLICGSICCGDPSGNNGAAKTTLIFKILILLLLVITQKLKLERRHTKITKLYHFIWLV